jgi:hypothetical protein
MRCIAALLAAALLLPLADADAQGRRYDNDSYRYDRDRYDRWEDRRENRRDARRTSIIAGAIAAGVTSSSKKKQAEQRYQQCVLATGYDVDCEARLDEERRAADRAAARASIVAGGAAYGIVRK